MLANYKAIQQAKLLPGGTCFDNWGDNWMPSGWWVVLLMRLLTLPDNVIAYVICWIGSRTG